MNNESGNGNRNEYEIENSGQSNNRGEESFFGEEFGNQDPNLEQFLQDDDTNSLNRQPKRTHDDFEEEINFLQVEVERIVEADEIMVNLTECLSHINLQFKEFEENVNQTQYLLDIWSTLLTQSVHNESLLDNPNHSGKLTLNPTVHKILDFSSTTKPAQDELEPVESDVFEVEKTQQQQDVERNMLTPTTIKMNRRKKRQSLKQIHSQQL